MNYSVLKLSVTTATITTNLCMLTLKSGYRYSVCNHIRRISTATPRFTFTGRVCRNLSADSKAKDELADLENTLKVKYGNKLGDWDPTKTDNKDPVLIYDGNLKHHIRRLKLFSFMTTVMGLTIQEKLYHQLQDSSIFAIVAVFSFAGFFTFVTPFLIHLMAKRYVTDMSYDPMTDEYTATIYSFFLRKKEYKFKVEDVIVPTVPGLLTTIHLKLPDRNRKYPLFLADVNFLDLKHFGRLMGYDKPIDFGITPEQVKAVAETRHTNQKI